MDSHAIAIDARPPSTISPRQSMDIEEPLLLKWRASASKQQRLHDQARAHYKGMADTAAIAAIGLASVGGLMNIFLGLLESNHQAINIAQIAIGATGVVSAGVMSTSNQLSWPQKAQNHEEYSARYSELVRMINTEEILVKLNTSSYASRGDFIKALKAEFDRIEDSSPPVPGFLA